MKNNTTKLFIMALSLATAMFSLTSLAFAAPSTYETSALGRIVGDSPDELARQLEISQVDLGQAIYFPKYTTTGEFNEKAEILENQFTSSKIDFNWNWDDVDEEIQQLKKNGFIVLEEEGSVDPLIIKGRQPSETIQWAISFANWKQLFFLNSEHSGTYLPKQETFIKSFGQDAITIAPTSYASTEFTKALLCNLGKPSVGEIFRQSRNNYYWGVNKDEELIGLTLLSYSLYGNPLASVKLPVKNAKTVEKLCETYLKSSTDETVQQFVSSQTTAGFQSGRITQEIGNGAILKVDDFHIIAVEGAQQRLVRDELVLPHQTIVTEFPLKTVVTGVTSVEFQDPVDITITDLPTWDDGFVKRTCYYNTKEAYITSSQIFTDDGQVVLIQINPVEVVDCEKGEFRLYRKVTYDIDFIPYSDVIIRDVDSPASGAPGSEAKASVEVQNIKEKSTSGKLVIREDKSVLGAEVVELSVGESKTVDVPFSVPDVEGAHTLAVEYLDGEELLTSKKFSIEAFRLKPGVSAPSKVVIGEDAEIKVTFANNGETGVIGEDVMVIMGGPPTESLVEGLIGYWPFENTEGRLADDFAGHDSTTETITNRIAAGINGNAWDFEKDNEDWVGLPAETTSSVTGSNPRTTSVWVKPESIEAVGAIIAWGESKKGCGADFKAIEKDFVDYLGFDNCGNVQAPASPEAGKWHHLVFTDDGNERQIYLNGDLIGTGNSAGSVTADAADIGAEHWDDTGTTNSHFDGLIDEVGIWNRALTPDEVAMLYYDGKGIFCTGDPCIFKLPMIIPETYEAAYSLLKGSSEVVSGNFDGIKLNQGENIVPVQLKTEGLEPGSYAFEVKISKGDYAKKAALQLFIAKLEEEAPQLADLPDLEVLQGAIADLNPSAVDLNGDYVTYSFSEPFNRFGNWQTGKHHEGEYQVDIAASDGKLEDKKTITVKVLPEDKVNSFADNTEEKEFTFARTREGKTADIRLLKKARVTEANILLEAEQP
ncbi:hypothetical protein HYU18_04200 [Candidatus Woesearchaeota archaeon]|nr:hypothetical protein [Candidatus Woesearchaeota archaeon]